MIRSAVRPDPPVTVRLFRLLVPPPGVGFTTVTPNTPPVNVVFSGITAVTSVALTNVVVQEVPATCTVELDVKLVPVTVKVSEVVPEVEAVGEMDVTRGNGLLMLKIEADEVPPPGVKFTTVTFTLPDDVTSVEAIVPLSTLPLVNVVVTSVLPNLIVAPRANFWPFTVSVNPLAPCATFAGDNDEIVAIWLLDTVIELADRLIVGVGVPNVRSLPDVSVNKEFELVRSTLRALVPAATDENPIRATVNVPSGLAPTWNALIVNDPLTLSTLIDIGVLVNPSPGLVNPDVWPPSTFSESINTTFGSKLIFAW
jgi:hypothetical protein